MSWSCTNQPIVDTPANQSESITNQFPSYVGTLSTYQGHADMLMRYTGSWVNPHWGLAYHRQDWDVDGRQIPILISNASLQTQEGWDHRQPSPKL